MRMNAKEQRTMAKIYKLYTVIEDERDLRRQKLSLVDYQTLGDMLKALSENKTCRTFNTSVANWLKKNGCNVEMDEHKVNYIITLA